MATPVRILSLLIFVAVMATGQLRVLLIGVALLIGAAIGVWQQHHGFDVHSLLRMMRRVRWLLLAILILYGWFTPGTALIPAWAPYSPSLEGLQQGLLRAAVLLAIVAAVYLLITTTPRGDLVAGLLWCGRPLRRLGVDDQRFAVRLVLALEAVPEVQTLARAALDKVPRTMPRDCATGSCSHGGLPGNTDPRRAVNRSHRRTRFAAGTAVAMGHSCDVGCRDAGGCGGLSLSSATNDMSNRSANIPLNTETREP